jgi:hypothetical protein
MVVETSGPEIPVEPAGVASAAFAAEFPGARFEGADVGFLEAHAESVNDKRIASAAKICFMVISFD